jgi:hypothetical protein
MTRKVLPKDTAKRAGVSHQTVSKSPHNQMKCGVISPQDWGLPVASAASDTPLAGLDVSPAELERRVRQCTTQWLPRHFDDGAGAFYGFYSAPERRFEPPQTVNLIAPWQLLAAYDRFQDAQFLTMARRAADWFYARFVVTHPMSVVIGGVRERLPDGELWTKFAAEFVILSAGLHARTAEPVYLDRARQSAGFLIQSARHRFSPKYDERASRWQDMGWQSFGRAIEAFLTLADITQEPAWEAHARRWGEFGLSIQAQDGGLYLIDGEYFNTDLAADELRAFVFLYERTQDRKYLQAAERFASWLLDRQRPDGAWPLTIDRDGNVVVPTVGPGDIPNIAIALFRLHSITREPRYLTAARLALKYSLSIQVIPGSEQPYADDPSVQWGFWSWDPQYDYTVSGDQATHHIRGFLFALDYLSLLEKR